MRSASDKSVGLSASGSRRWLWALMAASHLPGLVGSCRTLVGGDLSFDALRGCFLLTAATAFFVLKICDVAFLRFHTDRRSTVAIVLAIAFLHLGVVAPGAQISILPEYESVVATALLAGCMVRVRRAVIRATQSVVVRHRSATTVALSETAWSDPFRPHCWVLASRLFALRAPPHCN